MLCAAPMVQARREERRHAALRRARFLQSRSVRQGLTPVASFEVRSINDETLVIIWGTVVRVTGDRRQHFSCAQEKDYCKKAASLIPPILRRRVSQFPQSIVMPQTDRVIGGPAGRSSIRRSPACPWLTYGDEVRKKATQRAASLFLVEKIAMNHPSSTDSDPNVQGLGRKYP